MLHSYLSIQYVFRPVHLVSGQVDIAGQRGMLRKKERSWSRQWEGMSGQRIGGEPETLGSVIEVIKGCVCAKMYPGCFTFNALVL